MPKTLFSNAGGHVVLPDMVLVDRAEGGNLIVNPPRPVWDRSELTAAELTRWGFLVAATARAMLDVLPQLEGGCINYWDAGNWALNHKAEPVGPKRGPEHRSLHHHLIGRSRSSPRWGESPVFPDFAERVEWAARFEPLREDECAAVVERLKVVLAEKYGGA
jgi:hypothetical protein